MGNTVSTTTQPATSTQAATTTQAATSTTPQQTQQPCNCVYTEPATIPTTIPTTTQQNDVNVCNPIGQVLNKTNCNNNTNCIYASNYCYNLQLDKLGYINTTNIDCITNKNRDGSYNLSFNATQLDTIFLIKKIMFTIKDNDDTSDSPFLTATFIDLNINNPTDKSNIYVIDTNGALNFDIRIYGGLGSSNFDFTSIILTDINNQSITLSNTSQTNQIINNTSLTKSRNKVDKIDYDNTFALKTQALNNKINNSLSSLFAM
jgi:hypothetical protein